MYDIPLPDFGLFDLLPLPFAAGADPYSPRSPVSGLVEAATQFGFSVPEGGLLRCTANSSVYIAEDAVRQVCAIKISLFHQRLLAEYNNRQCLGERDTLVSSYDIFYNDSGTVLQMELCAGGDLHRKSLSEAECWKVVAMIGDALEHIHNAGFVHLDVSPSNIFRSDARFKLGDFGTLRAHGTFRPGDEGAGPYAAPEVFAAPEIVSWRADIFSFGVCLLELASGFFAPRGGEEKYRALRRGALPLGGEHYPCPFSGEFIALVNAALSPDPERRPTAARMAAVARSVMERRGLD
jgi:serine/threonine protein kinase